MVVFDQPTSRGSGAVHPDGDEGGADEVAQFWRCRATRSVFESAGCPEKRDACMNAISALIPLRDFGVLKGKVTRIGLLGAGPQNSQVSFPSRFSWMING